MLLKDKRKGIPLVVREKIDCFTEEDWIISRENVEMSETVTTREVVFGKKNCKSCTEV